MERPLNLFYEQGHRPKTSNQNKKLDRKGRDKGTIGEERSKHKKNLGKDRNKLHGFQEIHERIDR